MGILTTIEQMILLYLMLILGGAACLVFIISLAVDFYNKEIRSKKIEKKKPCKKCVWYNGSSDSCLNKEFGYAPVYFDLYPHKECEVWEEKKNGME